MRLQRYLAMCGVASRRKCEEMILRGRVSVNGEVVKTMGIIIEEGVDKIEVDKKPITYKSTPVCYMLYKEPSIVSTCKDPQGRPTVMKYFQDVKERLYPVGRLDYDTEGLLLMTNDGVLANSLTHPKFEVYKTYTAFVRGSILPSHLRKLERGIEIDGVKTSRAHVQLIKQDSGRSEVKITIHEGKNRQVRKMFLAIGMRVTKLRREQIGFLSLGNLKPGQRRKLSVHEVNRLLEEAKAGSFSSKR